MKYRMVCTALSSTSFVSKTKFNIQLNITKKRNNLNNLQATSSLFLINDNTLSKNSVN